MPFALGALAIDYDQRRVTVAGRRVELTATEYELLRVLAQDAGRVLTHETLLRRVWVGRPARAAPAGRSSRRRSRVSETVRDVRHTARVCRRDAAPAA